MEKTTYKCYREVFKYLPLLQSLLKGQGCTHELQRGKNTGWKRERTGLGQFKRIGVVYETCENRQEIQTHTSSLTCKAGKQNWGKNVSDESVFKAEPSFFWLQMKSTLRIKQKDMTYDFQNTENQLV